MKSIVASTISKHAPREELVGNAASLTPTTVARTVRLAPCDLHRAKSDLKSDLTTYDRPAGVCPGWLLHSRISPEHCGSLC